MRNNVDILAQDKVGAYLESLIEYTGYKGRYFKRLAELLGVKSVIIEKSYIDRHYMIDYTHYYSRSFLEHSRFTQRAHFFCEEIKESSLRTLITGGTESAEAEQLQDSYVGFSVKRPLQIGAIGRTCIPSPFDENRETKGRCFVKSTTIANLIGIPFRVDALVYQEQDNAVCACATVALWITLWQLVNKYRVGRSLSPAEITMSSFKAYPSSEAVRFPNEGLELHHMLGFLRQEGWEVWNINIKSVIELNRQGGYKLVDLFIVMLIRAFVNFNSPIIAILEMNEIGKEEEGDGHAVVISGVSSSFANGHSTDMKGQVVLKLYVHDDQVGPYVPSFLVRSVTKNTKNDEVDNRIELEQIEYELVYDLDESMNPWRNKRAKLRYLMVPVYHKIRLSFVKMFLKFIEFSREINSFERSILGSCLTLWEVGELKSLLLELPFKSVLLSPHRRIGARVKESEMEMLFGDDGKIEILTRNLPKYIWVMDLPGLHHTQEEVFLCYDATLENPWPLAAITLVI